MERFVGQTAVVTGAGGGIASAIVKELLKRDVNVVGLDKYIGKLKILDEEVSKNKQMFKGEFHFRECDISNVTQIQETFAWINRDFKSFVILVNGAGASAEDKYGLQNINETQYDVTFGTNTKGLIFCSKEALMGMMHNSIHGHIINICSLAGLGKRYYPFPIYEASKNAVRAFSDALKKDICRKRANIKVTNFSPALVKTDMSRRYFEHCNVSRDEYLDPYDIARTCISVLDTPPHVQISEILVEPLFHVDLEIHAKEAISLE